MISRSLQKYRWQPENFWSCAILRLDLTWSTLQPLFCSYSLHPPSNLTRTPTHAPNHLTLLPSVQIHSSLPLSSTRPGAAWNRQVASELGKESIQIYSDAENFRPFWTVMTSALCMISSGREIFSSQLLKQSSYLEYQ